MYLTLENEKTRVIQCHRAWSLQNKTKALRFSFSARLREDIHVSGNRGIRLHYTLMDFSGENLSMPENGAQQEIFEFVLTQAGAISCDGPHTGHLADIAEEIRCAWITPEVGINGLCWQTEPSIHTKLPHPLRTCHSVAQHRITQISENQLTIESLADVSLKLGTSTRMGPLHGSSTQITTLHKTNGPTKMHREVKVILHDPNQQNLLPAHIQSSLSVESR
jgi:hypothetical protein